MSRLNEHYNMTDEEIELVLNIVKYHSSFLKYGEKWYLQTEMKTENPKIIKSLRRLMTDD